MSERKILVMKLVFQWLGLRSFQKYVTGDWFLCEEEGSSRKFVHNG